MFVNYAHRGASAYAPENTLSAFYLGLQMGANGIETDIRRTKDNILVLFHDDSLERLAGVSGSVGQYSLSELREFGLSGNPLFTPDRIVTFESFLYLFGYRDLTFAIEIKEAGVEADTLRVVRDFGIAEKCIFTSFDYHSLETLRSADSEVRLGYLFKNPDEERIAEAKEIRCSQLCIHHQCLNEENVLDWRSNGFSIRAWGIETEEDMRRAALLADGGMTINFPDKLTEFWKMRLGK